MRNALRSFPDKVHKSSLLAFILVFLIGSVATLATSYLVHRQDRALVNANARQTDLALTNLLLGLQQDLRPIGPILSESSTESALFKQQIRTLLSNNPVESIDVVQNVNGVPVVALAVGNPEALHNPVPPDVAAAIQRVNALDQPSVLHFAHTPVQFNSKGVRFIGLAYRDAGFPSGSDLSVQMNLNALNDEPGVADLAPSKTTYNLHTHQPATQQNLVLASLQTGAKSGPAVTQPFSIGADSWILNVQAKTYLTDSATHFLPWIMMFMTLCLATAVAIAVEAVQRRSQYATALVDQRTHDLSDSVQAQRNVAARDALLRRTARDVASAPHLSNAFDLFCETLRDLISFDRAAFSVLGDQGARVAAVNGRLAETLPVGTIWEEADDLVARAIETGQSEIAYIDTEVATTTPQLRTRMAVPIIVAGQLQALVTAASTRPEAFDQGDLQNVERLSREASAPLYLLLVLDREREASERLRQLDQLKTDFVGMVAHDLRSPMTVISGFADFIRSNLGSLSEEEIGLYLERISDSTKHLSDLVEDVLQVARIESGELRIAIAEFDLPSLIRRVVGELAMTYENRTVLADVDPGLPTALGDETRQWQVLNNLLTNALKFSEGSERPVTIKVTHDDSSCIISVTDYGIGIPEEDIERIFDKFYRVEKQRNNAAVPGTGLGLFICKSLVEAQGGEIHATSSPEAGTTFTYTVPFVIRTDGQSQAQRDNAPTTRGATSELGRPGQ